MSREYTVKLSEKQLNSLMDDIIYCVDNRPYREERGEIHLKAHLSKTFPYTNFDKIKDEMTIDDFNDLIHHEGRIQAEIDISMNKPIWNKEDVKAFLESEVKDDNT